MHGLNLYDYSARYYDPAYGRFTTVDPLAEKFYNWSPYVYCYNNPVKFIDPDGKQGYLSELGTAFGAPPASIVAIKAQQETGWQGNPSLNIFTSEVKAPVAILGLISYGASSGIVKSQTASAGIILEENNKIQTYNTNSTGVETDVNISAGVGVELVFAEHKNNFSSNSLVGSSSEKNISLSLGKQGSLKFYKSTAQDKEAGEITTYGISISFSPSLKSLLSPGKLAKDLFINISMGAQINETTKNETFQKKEIDEKRK